MVGAIKQSIKQTTLDTKENRAELVKQVVYRYCLRPAAGQKSPLVLMFGDESRLCSANAEPVLGISMDTSFEAIYMQSHRASYKIKEIPP